MRTRQLFRQILLTTLFLLGFFTPAGHAHEGHMPVIVDTDAAVDDIRALALLLDAGADIRLIVTSDGVRSPQSGKQAMKRVLSYFGRPDIPLAAGKSLSAPPPQWRKWNRHLNWPDNAKPGRPGQSGTTPAETAIIERLQAFAANGQKAVYLCLGPMTNLAAALQEAAAIRNAIEGVVYLGREPDAVHPGWNTKRDLPAARQVFDSGLTIYAMGLADKQYPVFDNAFYESIRTVQSPCARLITSIHSSGALEKKMAENHLRIWDELAAVYLYHPGIFTFTASSHGADAMVLADYNADQMREKYMAMIQGRTGQGMNPRPGVTLKDFPTDPALFKSDLAPHVPEIIRIHGLEEWKACLLTNELHRHLGIYSLVGAKMGIRAREILNAPFDALEVVSFAGSEPPLSCLNDGLQVSTGASLGRGSIRVAESRSEPAAMFVYNQKGLTVRLKPRYVSRIKSDIQAALERFGGLNPAYFAHIRQLSIEYWIRFDRSELFEETLKSD